MPADFTHMNDLSAEVRVPSSTCIASKKAFDALVPPRLKITHVLFHEIITHIKIMSIPVKIRVDVQGWMFDESYLIGFFCSG